MCSKLILKSPERGHGRLSDVFVVNFEHVLYFLMVLFLFLKR